ncbi:hypothetical protein [Propionivibrio sp.]|uniref:hypothetical protein n=1 Tax=Propionivibrio sp. TaxID=2212460 RepID=UPI0025F89252|nr:hypothetical protein [Propionivibrio sp.]
MKRYFFESPLVRLMSDRDYGDVFVDGEDLVATDRLDCVIPYRSVITVITMKPARTSAQARRRPSKHFAKGLGTLILRLRDKVCADPKNAMAAGISACISRRAFDGWADLPRLSAEHVSG